MGGYKPIYEYHAKMGRYRETRYLERCPRPSTKSKYLKFRNTDFFPDQSTLDTTQPTGYFIAPPPLRGPNIPPVAGQWERWWYLCPARDYFALGNDARIGSISYSLLQSELSIFCGYSAAQIDCPLE